MNAQSFCGKCGARLTKKGWRSLIGRRLCGDCAHGRRRIDVTAPLGVVAIIALAAFSLGRFLRPAPPPLIIERAANSPLSDLPVNFNDSSRRANQNRNPQTAGSGNAETSSISQTGSTSDPLYICGARTKKGTPCKRRVHSAGERCFQHKGMPAILPLDKLIAKTP
jgi:hypothetical protein